jgi:hypothetical protein
VRASRRGRGDGKLYARAAPGKVEITENYSVTQEISGNPVLNTGPCAGRIEITIPLDGHEFFTRQAADDLRLGTSGRPGNGQGPAVIGHLLLADHTRTDLRSAMRQYNNAGVIPIQVPVPASGGDMDQLTGDRQTFVVTYDYQPRDPEVLPVELDVELHDPDTLNLQVVDVLARWGELDLAATIDQLRRDASFTSGIVMSITVQLAIPVKKDQGVERPSVKLVSVDWPAITSLRTTELEYDDPSEALNYDDPSDAKAHPVRYNPVLGRLEWEDIRMGSRSVPEGSGDKRVFESVKMRLKIEHPGELFMAEKLTMHAEVEIPNYLLSGLQAWLFDATGDWQRQPESGAPGGTRRPWEPVLTTRLSIETEFYVADMFAKRYFRPYQQYVFDDVIPDEMRITDIITVLRNSRFTTKQEQDPGNPANPNAPKWLISATRRHGPDTLDLLIAVEGEKYAVDREEIMGDNRIKQTRSKESGRMRLSVLGALPREHAELSREMNLLQQALRDRFRFQQQSSRR